MPEGSKTMPCLHVHGGTPALQHSILALQHGSPFALSRKGLPPGRPSVSTDSSENQRSARSLTAEAPVIRRGAGMQGYIKPHLASEKRLPC